MASSGASRRRHVVFSPRRVLSLEPKLNSISIEWSGKKYQISLSFNLRIDTFDSLIKYICRRIFARHFAFKIRHGNFYRLQFSIKRSINCFFLFTPLYTCFALIYPQLVTCIIGVVVSESIYRLKKNRYIVSLKNNFSSS